jgi:hypothetical protein
MPQLDEDLRKGLPAIHLTIQNSAVANLNLGTQVGTINVALESISQHGGAGSEFANAIKQLTEAVVSESTMNDLDKREVVEVLSAVAEEGAKQPEKGSTGTVKAAIAVGPQGGVGKKKGTGWQVTKSGVTTHVRVKVARSISSVAVAMRDDLLHA